MNRCPKDCHACDGTSLVQVIDWAGFAGVAVCPEATLREASEMRVHPGLIAILIAGVALTMLTLVLVLS